MSEEESVGLKLDPDTRLLRDDDLDAVTGGKVNHSDLVIVKVLDKATPILF